MEFSKKECSLGHKVYVINVVITELTHDKMPQIFGFTASIQRLAGKINWEILVLLPFSPACGNNTFVLLYMNMVV